MGIKIANSAVVNATQNLGETPHKDFQDRLMRYRTSIAVFRTMVSSGILTEADYAKSRDILAKKYGLSLCSIFR